MVKNTVDEGRRSKYKLFSYKSSARKNKNKISRIQDDNGGWNYGRQGMR